ncbi:putative major facilitator superfamily transporter [Gordonia namibiensis NBRC 108229]|uniref:Putative major facilitator superfamily transporter n=1 Tax=Gordonia namibiensis NBRC 108229 TaxID=1208314 RepID=K6VWL2_9ACTN|nr:MFS transporter [Gordonia namibiensis]GAC00629.1 putative major facilitator superfamily transporter [Gordonia namibiensis NBRC 108229]
MKSGESVVQALPWKWNVQGRIFIIGGLGYMFDAWDVVLNGFLTPLVGDYWDLDLGTRSLVATANLIGMAIGAVVWGSIADKMGRKKAFSVTMLIFALFSVIGAFSVNFEMFILFRFLAGFGLGGCIPVDYALVSEFSPRRLRGRILAAMDVWWPIGGTICGVVATLLVPVEADTRWRAMLIFMVLPALLLFWVRRGIPESPIYLARTGQADKARAVIDDMVARTGAEPEVYTISDPAPAEKMSWRIAITQLRDVWRFNPRITATAWALFITIMLLYYAALSWMPSILREQGHGDTAAFAGTTLMTGVGIVGVLTSAWLCEAYGRKWVIGLSGPLAGLAVALFAATLNAGTISLVFLCIFGFLIQLTIPVLYAYVSELYPTEIRASGFGWASAVSRVATGFAPLLFGTLLWPVVGLTATFAIAGVLVLAAVCWMIVGSPETKGRELDDIGVEPETPVADGVTS